MLKKRWIIFLTFMLAALSFPPFVSTASVDDDYIYWGSPKKGVYSELHSYTLNWSGDVLDKGGLNLGTMKITSKSSEADIVINQYGAIGASGMKKLDDEKLTDRTPRIKVNGFMSSYSFAANDIFLIVLHDGSYAKLRIDQVLPTKVSFSYVLEEELVAGEPAPTPAPVQTPKPTATPAPTTAPTPTPKPRPVPPVTEPAPFWMEITVDDIIAIVLGEKIAMEVPPTVVNGNTLVPVRFISEILGAEVAWDGNERKITITLQDKTIFLWINSNFAMVNGKRVELEVAPTIMNNVTVVPLRFISENFGQIVGYEPKTRLITITSPNGNGGDKGGSKPSPDKVLVEGEFPANLYGIWEFDYSNSWLNQSVGGISIHSDGTYIQRFRSVAEVKGRWRIAKAEEVKGHSMAIILQNGHEKSDWGVGLNDDGTIQMYQWVMISPGGLYGGRVDGWSVFSKKASKVSSDPTKLELIPMKSDNYDYSKFAGDYSLWVEGGPTNLYDKETGAYVTHRFTPGADGGTLSIKTDGTYTMETIEGKVTGKWRPSEFGEVFEREYSIILEDSPGGFDRALYVGGSGKYNIAYDSGSKWSDGSVMWIINYVANRK